MSLSITTSSYSRSSATAAAPKAQDPAELFKQLDTDQKGYLTASDIATKVTLSPEGTQRSDEEAQAMAEAAVKHMDSDGDGKVTEQEFASAAPPKPPAGGAKPQGAPPAGGGAGGGGKAGASSASAASSSKTYDPADANEDGTVSEQERQAYEAKHPTASASAARDRRAAEAVEAYEAVAEA